MKFLPQPTGELIVFFDKHERNQQIEFLESIITCDEPSEKLVQSVLDYILNNPHPWLKRIQ